MSYAQVDDIKTRLGADLVALLADEDGDGAGDLSILEAALEDADAEIDAALAGRYATPVASPPAVLRRIAADLAVHFLFVRRREAIAPEHERRWAEARRQLEAWAEGRADLHGAEPRLAGLRSESTTRDQRKRFDRETLEPF